MRSRLLKLFLLVISTGMTFGCTRSGKEDTSKVSLQLPSTSLKKVGALSSTAVLEHVIINVSGDGIPSPIIKAWDGCSDCTVPVTPPSEFNLEVPQGSNRLIQVLAVYVSDSGGDFFYGDTTQSFSKTEESASVNITSLTTGVNIESGTVMGRYFTAGGNVVTGPLLVKYNPTGKPSMVIDKSYIVAGWFQVFALKGLNFTYEAEGQVLFNDVNLDSAVFAADTTGNHVARMTIPEYEQIDGTARRTHEKRTYVLGWFGDVPAVSDKIVCYNPDPDTATAGPYIFQSFYKPGTNQKLTWSNASPNSDQITMQGARDIGSSGCNDDSQYLVRYFSVNPQTQVNNGGGESSIAGFQGIFRAFPAATGQTPKMVQMTNSGNDVVMKLATLQGVSSGLFDSVTVFKRTLDSSSEQFYFHDGVPCEALSAGNVPGFSQVADATLGSDAATLEITLPVPQSEQNRTYLALCPKRGTKHVDAGLLFSPSWFSGGPSGPTCSDCKYMRLEMTSTSSTGNSVAMVKDQCYPTKVKIFQTGVSTPTAAVVASLTLSNFAPAWAGLYSESSCTTPITGSVTITNNSESSTFYVKATTGGTDLTFSPTSSLQEVTIDPYQKFNVQLAGLALTGPSSVVSGQCYAYRLAQTNPGGGELINNFASSIDVTLTKNSASNATLYANLTDCTAGTNVISTASIPSGSSAVNVFIKPTAAVTVSVNESGHVGNAMAIAIGAGSYIGTHFRIDPNSATSSLGKCAAYTLTLLNDSDVPVPSPNNLVAKIDAGPTQVVYTDTDCMSASGGNSVTIPMGLTSNTFSLMANLTGTVSITAASGGIGSATTTSSFAPPTDPNVPYIEFNLPVMDSPVLGSHQFPFNMTFSVPAGVTVECATSPSFDFTQPCGAYNATTKVFSWTAADAIAGTAFNFKVVKGTQMTMYRFNPRLLYGHIGVDGTSFASKTLTIKTCNTVLTSGDFSTVQTAINTYTTVCLDAATWAAASPYYSLTIPAGKALIGRINPGDGSNSSILVSSPSLSMMATSTLVSGEEVLLANLNLNQDSTSYGRSLFYLDGATGSRGVSVHNTYSLATSGSSSIGALISAASYVSVKDKFVVYESSANTSSGLKVYTSNPDVRVFSPTFDLQNASSGTAAGLELSTSSGTAAAIVYDSRMTGNGTNFYTNSTSTGTSGLTISGCSAIFGSTGYNNAFLKGAERLSASISLCRVDFNAATAQVPVVLTAGSGVSPTTNLITFRNNVFRQYSNESVISTNTSFAQNLVLVGNHFMRMASGTAGSTININGTTNVKVDSGLPSHGNNLFCYGSSSAAWSGPVTGTLGTVSPTAEQFATGLITMNSAGTANTCVSPN